MGDITTDLITALQAILGDDASDAVAAFLTRFTTYTNDSGAALVIKRTTTGNAADGFGVGIDFYIEDSAGVEYLLARITAERDGADTTGKLRFYLNSAGTPTERIRLQNSIVTILTGLNVYYGVLTAGANGSQRGTFTAHRGGGSNTPGCLCTYALDGTPFYWFAETDGTARISSTLPTADTDGQIIGTQF